MCGGLPVLELLDPYIVFSLSTISKDDDCYSIIALIIRIPFNFSLVCGVVLT